MAISRRTRRSASTAEAESRIAAALAERATHLDLGGLGLTALPEALGKLAQLQTLDVAGNRLTALPVGLRELSCLRALYLYGNSGLAIPEELLRSTSHDLVIGKAKTADPKSILDYYF